MLHPSRPIFATGETSPLPIAPKRRSHSQSLGGGLIRQPQTEGPGVSTTQSKLPSPTNKEEVIWQMMPPPGFLGVTACLWRDQLMGGVCKLPVGPSMIEVILAPAVAIMSMSHIVRDEVTRVTYMDTLSTLVGRVTLSSPKQETLSQGPTIQNIMDLV